MTRQEEIGKNKYRDKTGELAITSSSWKQRRRPINAFIVYFLMKKVFHDLHSEDVIKQHLVSIFLPDEHARSIYLLTVIFRFFQYPFDHICCLFLLNKREKKSSKLDQKLHRWTGKLIIKTRTAGHWYSLSTKKRFVGSHYLPIVTCTLHWC